MSITTAAMSSPFSHGLSAALRDITAWLPATTGPCPAQGRPAAAREKPASPAFRSHAQGSTLGSSRKTSAFRFSRAAIRRLALRRGRVQLNPSKTILQPVHRGIDFVGQVIKPWRRTTRRRTLASALQRIEHLPAAEVFSAGNSYLGLVRQASHSHKERAAVCRALLKRGHAVEGMNLSKAFRRNEA